MLFFGPAPHSSLKCETAWEYKITCKLRVVHVGCLKLRVESTYTVALFLQCAHSLGHNVPNPCCCAGPLVAITQEKYTIFSAANSSYKLIFLKIRAKYEHFFNKNTSKIRAKIRVKLKFLFLKSA